MELVITGGRLQSLSILGLSITRKAVPGSLASVDNRGGWWPIIRESFAGAWQSNVTVDTDTVLSHYAVYACISLIASDVGKMRLKLMRQDADGIWSDTDNAAYSPVLRKPNHFQTRIQFLESWVASKLIHGNAYVLKERDNRGVVIGMYVLDPVRTKPLVAPNGEVFYQLHRDELSGVVLDAADLNGTYIVPASEIMHDTLVPMFHQLVGVSPIRACGIAAMQGLRIQENATLFFQQGSYPGGLLTAPGFIKQEVADRIKAYWSENFSGSNVGKVAVLGDGVKFERMSLSAVDAQLIDQLKLTAENICTAFRVPPYKIGVGPAPNYQVVEALDQQYYSQCLQTYVEHIEAHLDRGLGMLKDGARQEHGTEFDTDDLIRMDTLNRIKAAKDSIQGGGLTFDEARRKFYGLGKVKGGSEPYMQEQNFSLSALAERDQDKPFSKATPAPEPTPAPPATDGEPAADPRDAGEILRKAFAAAAA